MRRGHVGRLVVPALLALVALPVPVAAGSSPSAPLVTQTFTTPGGPYSFVVPDGVTSIQVAAIGAAGGGFASIGFSAGGSGASVTATLPVNPGQSLAVYVGGNGYQGYGGFNGGGNGGGPDPVGSSGAGGGGASDVRTTPGDLSSRLVVASGGGGAMVFYGGGNAGEPGHSTCCITPAQPGTASAGGAGQAAYNGGTAGADGTVGAGGAGGGYPGANAYGGGGGGGWYGGGGGHAYGGGAGGSSYTAPSATDVSVGLSAAAPQVSISYAATTPGAPTIGAATPGDGQASVSWSAPASDGGSAVTGYVVTPYIGPTAQTPVTFSNDPSTTQTITGLTNGTKYSFRVAAVNEVGTGPQSAASNVVRPAALPGAPAVTAATAGAARATVSWNPPTTGGTPITGYVVTPYIGAVAQTPVLYDASTTTRTLKNLGVGVTYTFTVAARNAIGQGPESAPSDPVTPYGLPGAPTIGRPVAGDSQVTLSWRAPADGGSPITGYVVTPYTATGAQTPVVFAGDPATTQIITGLTNGTTYRFRVAAINAAGTGPQSALSRQVTPSALA